MTPRNANTRLQCQSWLLSRRDFSATLARSAALLSCYEARAQTLTDRSWRTFQLTTRVEVLKPSGITRIWVPAALLQDAPYQRTLANSLDCEGGTARIVENKADGLGVVAAEFAAEAPPRLTVNSNITTRDWSVNLSAAQTEQKADATELQHYLRATKLLPIDGIVKTTATQITAHCRTDLEKARAIYDWIVKNTYRNPNTRGCGLGDIRFMLQSHDLGGKCADLNALYIGLARAAGLPAREVYGVRTAKSKLGYKSLGPSSGDVTKMQHCRAEVYVRGYGWTPVDPADVRKVMLEEPPGNRKFDDAMVQRARLQLFGSWEMNWIGYNFAHDVELPGSSGRPLPFFMYPQAETGGRRLNSLDPESFWYQITSKEIAG